MNSCPCRRAELLAPLRRARLLGLSMTLSRPLRLDSNPAELASSLRGQHGRDAAWLFATRQADAAIVVGDTKAAIHWRRVVNALDGLET